MSYTEVIKENIIREVANMSEGYAWRVVKHEDNDGYVSIQYWNEYLSAGKVPPDNTMDFSNAEAAAIARAIMATIETGVTKK